MIRRLFRLLAGWVSEIRTAQQDALSEMLANDSVLQGLDVQDVAMGCAEEGAQPPVTTGAGLTPAQLAALRDSQADDWWLDWLMPSCVTGCAIAGAAAHLGWF